MGLSYAHPRAISTAVSLLSITVFVVAAVAQQPKVPAPHQPFGPKGTKPFPLPPAVPGAMVGGPWMVDASFKSSIYLKNGVETSPVTVTPILYLSNGIKYTLPDVQLAPSGTSIVDINAALQNLGIAPYATLNGYVEVDYSWPWDPICATIRNVDTVHSLIFNYGLRSSKPFQLPNHPARPAGPQVFEGLWWKQEPNVTGFVALANTGPNPLTARVDLSDSQGSTFAQHTVTISAHGMKLIDMPELASAPTPDGGVRISYGGNSTDLVINGGLQDQAVGYSAEMPIGMAPPLSTSSNAIVAELGLMTGQSDPMMQFPAGIIFTPYTVLRNVSGASLAAIPTLWWMANGTAQSAQLPGVTLASYQSQTLDVPGMLTAAGLSNFSGSVNLIFDVQGNTGGLLIAGGSVDQNNTYVFETTPHGIGESVSKSLSYWSIANGDDTMVTLWNGADEAQDVVFRLTFSSGSYELPIHLNPRATQAFNISEIVQSQTPDANGSVIPLSVQEGGATLAGSLGDNQHILVAMDAGTYNVKKATCGLYCQTCNGVTSFTLVVTPFSVPVTQKTQESFHENWNTGNYYDDTATSTWTSSNTALATVQTGLVTGVSPGSPNISARYIYNDPLYTSYWCEGSSWSCPYSYTSGSGTASGNVTPSVSFSSTQVQVGQNATISATVTPSANTTPISLSISSPASIVSPTGTFTQSTSVIVHGLSVGTATLTATVSNSDGTKPTVGSTSFQVVPPPPSVTISQNNSGTIAAADTARSGYHQVTGTYTLGVQANSVDACFAGLEDVGTVNPSNYSGTLQFHRTLTSCGTYKNSSTPTDCGSTPRPDGPPSTALDGDPSSSGGKIFDWDAPGVASGTLAGSVYRFRANFSDVATLSDGVTTVSSPYNYYVRLSCKFDSSGNASLDTTVPGDNQIGQGTTKTSWNLQ